MKKSRNRIILVGALGLFLFLAAPVLAAPDSVNFFVDPGYDSAGRSEVTGDLLLTTSHAYFYVERSWWQTLNAAAENDARKNIEDLSTEFNQRIYPLMVMNYGDEWRPGIDNDERITIFITKLREGVAGYFNAADEETQQRIANSNEREMLYLSSNFLSSSRLKAFLAHEFQHLITYYQKTKRQGLFEETWLNEARSEYAPTLLGYDDFWTNSNLQRRVEEFLRNPSDSLTEWRNDFADYGVANVFIQYLVDHFGQEIIGLTTKNNQTGIESISSALAAKGSKKTFSDVFTDWSVATFLNNCAVEAAFTYCFFNKNLDYSRLHVSLDFAGQGESITQTGGTKDWAANFFQVDYSLASKVLKVDFSSSDPRAKFRIPYVLFFNNGSKLVKEMVVEPAALGQQKTLYIKNFGKDIISAVFIPHNEYKTVGFSSNEPVINYKLNFSLVSEVPPEEPSQSTSVAGYPDGTLIRQQGDSRVYVIKGKYKRWIQAPAIMAMYPHFQWSVVKEVTAQEMAIYQDAWLVRADGDFRVYEINGDGTKHWLNMTAEWFAQSGRSWDMVYVINKQEREWYRTGANVLR